MADQDVTAIPMKRGRQLYTFVVSSVLVATFLWVLTLDAEAIAERPYMIDPALERGLAVFGIVLFGALATLNLRKLLDRRPGLVLSAEGLEDRSTFVAIGFVPWSDITGVDSYRALGQRTLVLKVADPKKYLGGGNAVARYLRRSNLKLCGSPVTITTATLKIRYDNLMAEIQDYLRRHGQVA